MSIISVVWTRQTNSVKSTKNILLNPYAIALYTAIDTSLYSYRHLHYRHSYYNIIIVKCKKKFENIRKFFLSYK